MQQRGKTCWGEGDHDHRANREIERGAHLTLHSLPAAGGQAREGQPLRCIGSGRGGAAGCGSRHPSWGCCSGIASMGYHSGQLQQQPATACSMHQRISVSDGMSRMRRRQNTKIDRCLPASQRLARIVASISCATLSKPCLRTSPSTSATPRFASHVLSDGAVLAAASPSTPCALSIWTPPCTQGCKRGVRWPSQGVAKQRTLFPRR
jgi:hypothetical protein